MLYPVMCSFFYIKPVNWIYEAQKMANDKNKWFCQFLGQAVPLSGQ